MGLSKVIMLVGAGFTGSVLIRNGKLSDILGDLQMLLKGLDKSGDGVTDTENSALVSQIERLAREVQRMASARPVTIIGGDSGSAGNLTSLITPAATLGAVGYGYMWWKGISFSDLMYVTKANMANAVSSMTKHLEQVSAALAATKRHLTQRIENLDGKLDEQKEMSKDIKNQVTDARGRLVSIGNELTSLQELVWGLNGKMSSIEAKQNVACAGVLQLCDFAIGKGGKMPHFLQEAQEALGKQKFLGFSEATTLKGLADIIRSENCAGDITADGILGGTTDCSPSPRCLSRTSSFRS